MGSLDGDCPERSPRKERVYGSARGWTGAVRLHCFVSRGLR